VCNICIQTVKPSREYSVDYRNSVVDIVKYSSVIQSSNAINVTLNSYLGKYPVPPDLSHKNKTKYTYTYISVSKGRGVFFLADV
jgi:hypothetical protein